MHLSEHAATSWWPSTSREFLELLKRQRLIFVIIIALSLVIATVVSLSAPKYQAHMKIVVQRQRAQAVISSSSSTTGAQSSDQVSEVDLNSEVELLNSEDLLRRVVLSTDLSRKVSASPGADREKQIERIVRRLNKALSIQALRKSNVISVQFTDTDPELAAQVLRTLATVYISKHLELNRSAGDYQFFDQQVEQYKQGLQDAEDKLIRFTHETGIVSAVTEEENALKTAATFDLAARQAQVEERADQGRVQQLAHMLKDINPRITTAEKTGDNPQQLLLKSTLLTLELKREELVTKFPPSNRLVQEVERQIADARTLIAEQTVVPLQERTTDQNPDFREVREELIHSQADLQSMDARAAAANADAAHYREQASKLQQNRIQQDDLIQQIKTQQDNYLLYVRKREEAHIERALDQRGIVNVALAEKPLVPALPTRSPLYMSALVIIFGLPLSFVCALAADVLDDSLKTPDKTAALLGIPVIATLSEGSQA